MSHLAGARTVVGGGYGSAKGPARLCSTSHTPEAIHWPAAPALWTVVHFSPDQSDTWKSAETACAGLRLSIGGLALEKEVNPMVNPTLLVLAAGTGSRSGGPKGTEPVGHNGELIVDYSIYDARRSGF